MADDKLMSQDEIERLLSQATSSTPAAEGQKSPAPAAGQATLEQSEIESLLAKGAGTPPGDAAAQSAQRPQTSQGSQTAVADDQSLLGQDEIEKLFGQATGGAPPSAGKHAAESREAGPAHAAHSDIAQADVEYLLNQAEQALRSINSGLEAAPTPGVGQFRLEEFTGPPASTENATLDLIRDVELDLKIELGRTHMYLDDVLRLRKGSVVPLDKLAGDPVDIYVNGRLIARGEVLVLNDNFCVRVAELIAGAHPNV